MNTRRMNGDKLEICINDEVVLSFTEKVENGVMYMKVSGDIRNEAAHDFEDEIMAAFSFCTAVRIDMSEVTYIASFALKALLSIQQIIDENNAAGLVIENLSPVAKEMFVESGFMDILNIEEG